MKNFFLIFTLMFSSLSANFDSIELDLISNARYVQSQLNEKLNLKEELRVIGKYEGIFEAIEIIENLKPGKDLWNYERILMHRVLYIAHEISALKSYEDPLSHLFLGKLEGLIHALHLLDKYK